MLCLLLMALVSLGACQAQPAPVAPRQPKVTHQEKPKKQEQEPRHVAPPPAYGNKVVEHDAEEGREEPRTRVRPGAGLTGQAAGAKALTSQ